MMDQVVKFLLLFAFIQYTVGGLAQDQSGFISIDCGIPDNSNYTDGTTGINYVSDVGYIDTGLSKSISPLYKTNDLAQQLTTVKSFPQGLKNCYTLVPPKLKDRARYFVRASFMYGNYDNKSQIPKFDIYLGVNYWDTIAFVDENTIVRKEILYNPSSNYIYVCLVNTKNGTPFISVLELRLVDDGIYTTTNPVSSLALVRRSDLRSYDNKKIIRYEDDIFDRVWQPSFFESGTTDLNTILNIKNNNFLIPSTVLSNAVTPPNANGSLDFYWEPTDLNAQYYVYMHFADLQSSQTREFNITLNGVDYLNGTFRPDYLAITSLYTIQPMTRAKLYQFSFFKTVNSELPPIINALEIYMVKNFSGQQTDQKDVHAIKSIKLTYGVDKNWQGDPCTPYIFSWLGLTCFNDSLGIPRISSLNLSFSGLTGTISPFIIDLDMLESLDLSNNNLTGELPEFLSQIEKLSVLNLSRNNFTGTIPADLSKRSTDGFLTLIIEGNPYLCSSDSCKTKIVNPVEKEKKNSMSLIIIVSVVAFVVLLIALAVLSVCIIRKKKSQPKREGANGTRDGPLLEQRRNYTYSEVSRMTKKFERELGKGGFGSVFHGSMDGTQVAVKMLSLSSGQGYKQFKAEAELLMRVHHRNLTTLVGYCDEGDDKLGLIYEFMANGDVETHLSDQNRMSPSWSSRLMIALDAARGLEYLHTGCKPPIIHRDIKTANILLNEEMQAKLADFGLSKAFRTGDTHSSTNFAGTPGYFDPEYNINETSDVYSFGVVLLEILTGKPPIARDEKRTHISRWVAKTLERKGDVRNVVDPRLSIDFDVNSAWKFIDIAMECASETSVKRPTMSQVVDELEGCVEMETARITGETVNETDNSSTRYSDLYSNFNIETTGMNHMSR